MTQHTDRELEYQLEALRGRLLRMAGLVENMIGDAVRSLVDSDLDLARATMSRDIMVNRLEVEADEQCLLILARWQPVASDLRFLTIALKMVTDLERMGDLAVNICERAVDLSKKTDLWPWATVEEMTRITRGMVQQSVDAFLNADAQLARDVVSRDDAVDELYTEAFEQVVEVMRKNTDELNGGVHALSVVKWIERIADHATSLAELVVFMVGGKDIRHAGREEKPRPAPLR